MMRVISIVLLLLMGSAQAEKICRVHDGDTFYLCNGQSIRLWGVDTPELKQPLGKEAREFTKKYVLNKDIDLNCLRTKKGKIKTDRHKRWLCGPIVNGLELQKELVGWGMAYDYPKYSKGQFSEAETFANKMKRGVWGLGVPQMNPHDFRAKKRNRALNPI